MVVLLLNAGSSSLKSSVIWLETGEVLARGTADWSAMNRSVTFAIPSHPEVRTPVDWTGYAWAVDRFMEDLHKSGVLESHGPIQAVGHRIVYGGPFRSAVRITPDVRQSLAALIDLAPLHNPPSLETLAAAERALPGVPQIASFDTTFHATLPPEAFTYAVPWQWTTEWGIRRYGFHGLSHSYCAERTSLLLGRPLSGLKIVSCHLGHGCSLAAIDRGVCIDTTMGYTPMEGLVMGTRSGSIDPGAILHLQKTRALTAVEIETKLNRESGLLGISGVSSDMRQILEGVSAGHPRCTLALNVFLHRLRQGIGAMAASLGGLDALAFTGGVGEHAVTLRQDVCERLGFLGLVIDSAANAVAHTDAVLSSRQSRVGIVTVTCREDLSMLSEVRAVLARSDTVRRTTSPTQLPEP